MHIASVTLFGCDETPETISSEVDVDTVARTVMCETFFSSICICYYYSWFVAGAEVNPVVAGGVAYCLLLAGSACGG